jgi:hypothetical protein
MRASFYPKKLQRLDGRTAIFAAIREGGLLALRSAASHR